MVSGRFWRAEESADGDLWRYTDHARCCASGLGWVAKQQAKDGSWSLRGPYNDGGTQENKPAATAMALLAFSGDGHTHLEGEYKDNVAAGIKWLVAQQDATGSLAKKAQDHQQAYAQHKLR